MATRANKRVQRELEKFLQDSTSDGLAIEVQSEDCWNVKFSAAVGTIYEGENYTLQVKCKFEQFLLRRSHELADFFHSDEEVA